jgi:hypothetical protein
LWQSARFYTRSIPGHKFLHLYFLCHQQSPFQSGQKTIDTTLILKLTKISTAALVNVRHFHFQQQKEFHMAASARQIEANRRNAAGPHKMTEAGKQSIRTNALRHGLATKLHVVLARAKTKTSTTRSWNRSARNTRRKAPRKKCW